MLQIVKTGGYVITTHARERMAQRDLQTPDVLNVLKAGLVESVERENGRWRYRMRTQRICIVVQFRSETELEVVTGWRL